MAKFAMKGKYLKYQDLIEGDDLVVTIESYQLEELGKDDKKEQKWVLYFEDMEQGLALNKTNGKLICKLYGEEMDDWIGKRIALYVKDDVQFGEDTVSAIRVRPKMPVV